MHSFLEFFEIELDSIIRHFCVYTYRIICSDAKLGQDFDGNSTALLHASSAQVETKYLFIHNHKYRKSVNSGGVCI